MADLPTGTVTLLFTDIEGSTRLWEQHPEAMKAALACHDGILRQAIEAADGYVFKTVGDAFCAVFLRATDAVAAAVRGQQALQVEPWGKLGQVKVRMAVHTGEAELRDDDYFGPPLNRVARILSAGHGGQILLSAATQELVRDHLPAGASLRDLGDRRLKDLIRAEHVFQVAALDLPTDFPPLKTLDTRPNNLPVQPTSFIGREREIAEVKRLLGTSRLLTLTGAGGAGKTRLALQTAADLLDEYPDGVWLVELAPLANGELVPQSVASALGVPEQPNQPILTTLVNVLKDKRLLVLLDNCEHLVEACARLADAVLRSCPQVRFLGTSREALGIAGEVAWRIPSLPVPEPGRLPPTGADLAFALSQYEAVRLFIERAAAVNPAFTVTNDNAPAIAQVCWRLDGIPLAIELAAARVKVLPVGQIARRIDDRFRLLTGGSRTALPRQQTLRGLIDWSYDLLSEPERILWRRLAVFAGGFTLEAAEKVCAGEGIEEYEVLDLLTQLVDKSVVLADEHDGLGRYRLLETIRQYGRDRLVEAGEAPAVRGRHRDWCLALAEQAEPELVGPNQRAWLDRVEIEHDNLRAALERCLESDALAGLRLAGSISQFWWVGSYLTEGRRWLDSLLAEAPGRTAVHARALQATGLLAEQQGDLATSWTLLEQSLALFRELGDRRGIATSVTYQGLVAWFQGDFSRVGPLLEEGLAIFRDLGDKRGAGFALRTLGDVAQSQGDLPKARALYEEALVLLRQAGDGLNAIWTLVKLATALRILADTGQATRHGEEALDLSHALRVGQGVGWALDELGSLARVQGDYATAQARHKESLAVARETGNNLLLALGLSHLGNLARLQGEYQQAEALLESSLVTAQETGAAWIASVSLSYAGVLSVAAGDQARAARILGAATARHTQVFLDPGERADLEAGLAAARAVLGEDVFGQAWAEGQAMTLEQAIAHTLGNDDRR